jgi:hypothetical protein
VKRNRINQLISVLITVFFCLISQDSYALAIQIESSFDSGNLRMATKIGPGVYNIELEPYNDAAIWFHFRAIGVRDSTVTFNLLNGESGENIWNWLNPAVSSDWKNWSNITTHSYDGQVYSFTYTFPSDTAYICTHPAFNNEMMDTYLDTLQLNPKVVTRSTIATSVQGRPVDMVQLTDPSYPDTTKLGVWLISRQHASELPGWYVLQGLMNWLLSNDPHAIEVMKHMIFNIVPLMNPDGVYLGKYRTTSLNIDLNRQWNNANQATEPSVYAVTQQVNSWVNSGKNFSYFNDFHSTKNGTTCFIYRASSSLVPGFISQTFYDNQTAFLNLIGNNCPLININYPSSISTSAATTVSRQYMIANYQHLTPNFLAFLYEGVNVFVSYGPYIGQTMTIELEHLTGEGFGESLYQFYVAPLLNIDDPDKIINKFKLVSVYPNPFNSQTTFKIETQKSQNIKLDIFNSLGQHVTNIINERKSKGQHYINWNAHDVSSGIYYYRIFAGDRSDTGKIVYLK